ncbi:substrate-binding domain-containing protein [Gemmata sp.]|uniref:substrate-binding domain-containing protein n=1 Tax=Gemmata sp. TaxID=1914242 RepID=UPI003F6F1257
MLRSLRLSVVPFLAVALACVPACNKKSDRIKIGVVTNCTAEFWSFAEAGANKAARDFDVDLQFRQLDKAFDASAQTPIIDSWVKQGLNGIAVSVIDPQNQTEDLTRVAKKVPLVTMDNDADQTGRLCYIGINNYEAGRAVGRIVKKELPRGGTVALFIGSTKSANGKARTQGVLDELAGQKDAAGTAGAHPTRPELKGKQFGPYFLVDGEAKEDGGPANAQALAGAVLARLKGLPDVGLVGLYAYNPPALLVEARSKAMLKDVKIVGFDVDWDTLKGIANGEIAATVVQDPFMYGYRSVEALAAKARGDDSKLVKEPIPYRVVTQNGGPDETVNGMVVKYPKVSEFEAKLREDLASVKK